MECQVVREHDFKLVAWQAVDLSPDGMLVLADASVLTGEDVIISFRAPVSRVWFDSVGTVARIVHGRRPGDIGPCLGIQFDDIDLLDQAALRANLKSLPPPLPRREARLDYAAMVAQHLW
jgi:PilZ domain